MNEQTVRNLEFGRITEKISSYCATASARQKAASMGFFSLEEDAERALEEVAQAMDLSLAMGGAPFYGYQEIEPHVRHAEKGGLVRNAGLRAISSALRTHQQARRYVFHEENPALSYPLLEEIAGEITPIPALEREIESKIVSEDDVADDASPALFEIRRKMRKASAEIKERLASMTGNAETRKLLQDPIVTMRQGRYVVPVKSENRSQVDGIIHDTSSTGLTLFIEPQAVVSLNNQLRALEGEESREIEKILADLSAKVRSKADFLLYSEERIVELDLVFAKASFAFASRHARPEISRTGKLVLRDAFHPLIGYEKCVPSDVSIGEAYWQVVITGPNTGGKTVLIKTLGLCALMAAAGLFIPAGEGSSCPLFDDVFSDIGDEQSIEQSLSTFSSHMKRIVEILSAMTPRSLVLVDEIGAGTDPSEGAALARAILDAIRKTGAVSLATTHYSEIKRYALLSEGVTNASMEFDAEKLMPTYRLNVGVPGKSSAFEISARLGLSSGILSEAASYMSDDSREFEDVIGLLEEKYRLASAAFEEAKAEASKAREARKKIEEDLAAFRSSRDRMLSKASVEAKAVVASSRQKAREIISEAERFRASSQLSSRAAREAVSHAANEALDAISSIAPEARPFSPEMAEGLRRVLKGERVYIPSLNAEGTVLEPYGEDALVQVGAIKTRVALSRMSQAKGEASLGKAAFSNSKPQTVSSKLDMRGATAAEAEIELDKYLDDAVLANLKTVTIVHGKGSGALKKAVEAILSAHPAIEGFRTGGLREGGEGATIATLI
jgi:DNA mismatch repair protein MutS2